MLKKTVLITGCSSGIGAALARECHRQGYAVIATARSPESLAALRELGVACYRLDVNESAGVESLMATLAQKGQEVDFLINNAGFGTMAAMADLEVEGLEAQFRTNVFSILRVTNAVIPGMIARKSGCIINIGSVSGILTSPFAGAYCASKAAVHSLSEAYRMELAPFGINVVTVQPGAIASSFGDNAGAVTEDLIRQDSAYRSIESAIRRRARASQERPTSAEEFARILCRHMNSATPPAVIRIGNGSWLLPLLARLLPTRLLDFVRSRPFELWKLSD